MKTGEFSAQSMLSGILTSTTTNNHYPKCSAVISRLDECHSAALSSEYTILLEISLPHSNRIPHPIINTPIMHTVAYRIPTTHPHTAIPPRPPPPPSKSECCPACNDEGNWILIFQGIANDEHRDDLLTAITKWRSTESPRFFKVNLF